MGHGECKMENTPQFLNEKEVASMLGLKASTLRVMRCVGAREGHVPPLPFIKVGRAVRYDRDTVIEYMKSLTNNAA